MAQKKASETPHPAPGRLRSAWHVLMGTRVTPLQIQAEWLEYKLIFDDIMTRLGAQLARAARAGLAGQDNPVQTEMQLGNEVPKAQLRKLAAARQGLRVMGNTIANPDQDEP